MDLYYLKQRGKLFHATHHVIKVVLLAVASIVLAKCAHQDHAHQTHQEDDHHE